LEEAADCAEVVGDEAAGEEADVAAAEGGALEDMMAEDIELTAAALIVMGTVVFVCEAASSNTTCNDGDRGLKSDLLHESLDNSNHNKNTNHTLYEPEGIVVGMTKLIVCIQ
jgi:hypothetical protein